MIPATHQRWYIWISFMFSVWRNIEMLLLIFAHLGLIVFHSFDFTFIFFSVTNYAIGLDFRSRNDHQFLFSFFFAFKYRKGFFSIQMRFFFSWRRQVENANYFQRFFFYILLFKLIRLAATSMIVKLYCMFIEKLLLAVCTNEYNEGVTLGEWKNNFNS